MPQDLDAVLRQVHDEASFIAFVEALATDFEEESRLEQKQPRAPYSSGPLGWQNGSVGAMLDAVAAWGRDTALSLPDPATAPNPWYRCAHMLYAGKFYE
jgi:hypothetical protein